MSILFTGAFINVKEKENNMSTRSLSTSMFIMNLLTTWFIFLYNFLSV